jgi:hypothetical protein
LSLFSHYYFFYFYTQVLELVNLCLFVGVFATRIFINVYLSGTIDIDPEQTGFSDFYMVATANTLESNMNCINCMLCYFKVLKYMYIWPRIDLLVQSLMNAKMDLMTVGFIFFIIFSGFSMCFTLVFANDIADFYTFARSYYSLMLMMLGDFDFQLISALTGPLGVSLFLVFMMVTFMTLANITIAVICNRYAPHKPAGGSLFCFCVAASIVLAGGGGGGANDG